MGMRYLRSVCGKTRISWDKNECVINKYELNTKIRDSAKDISAVSHIDRINEDSIAKQMKKEWMGGYNNKNWESQGWMNFMSF